jgi:YVTN family beta-propeller protein
MKARWFRLCLVIALQLSGTNLLGQESLFRVLAFYSTTTEPDHVQFAQDAVKFFTERAAVEHFTFEATTRWDDLNDERLRGYELVVWLNESPTKTEQRSAFERYMQHGGAWLGFHAAAYNDNDTNWPWFVDFLGGAIFFTNSWPPLPARLAIDDHLHPVTATIPGDFESPANEWYAWRPSPRLNKDVRILATLDPSNYPIGLKDVLVSGDLPVVWANTKYKMIYMNMGHGDKIFTSPVQNELINHAIHWLGMGARLPATPEAKGIRISPHGLALNSGSGKFYAVNTSQGRVTVLDGDGRFVTRIPVGAEPESIAVNPNTNRVYVSNSGSGTVSVIDGAMDKVIETVPVGALPYAMAVNPAADRVYVSRTFSDVTVIIDGKTNIARTLKAGVGDAVSAESLDHNTYLVTYESPQVTVFDSTNDQISRIKATIHPWAIAANPATHKVYVVNSGSANVTVIDARSQATKLVKTGETPCAVAVDSILGKVYVTNYTSGSVTVIDGVNDSIVNTVGVGPHPQAIAVDSSNHKVYVASSRAGAITVLDGANGAALGTIKTGALPFAVAVNDKTHTAVALGLAGDLAVINGVTWAISSPAVPEKER